MSVYRNLIEQVFYLLSDRPSLVIFYLKALRVNHLSLSISPLGYKAWVKETGSIPFSPCQFLLQGLYQVHEGHLGIYNLLLPIDRTYLQTDAANHSILHFTPVQTWWLMGNQTVSRAIFISRTLLGLMIQSCL